MSHRITRRQTAQKIEAMVATAKVTACHSRHCPKPPADLTSKNLRMLTRWAAGHDVVFLHDSVEERLYRLPFYPGQGEWVHRDIRDEVEVRPGDGPKAVVLYDVPQHGPENGQIHYGIVAWEDSDGPEEVEVMVYRRPRL